MSISSRSFGTTKDGLAVTEYTLTNQSGACIKVINLGAILTSIIVPDRDGKLADVALGFDTLEPYAGHHGSMGDTIGRYGNRIAGAQFTLDGVSYKLAANNGRNSLHGGPKNFSTKLWDATPIEQQGKDSLRLHLVSPDGEEGFPGTLDVTVTYSWDDLCNLGIRYEATTDKATLCNLTNHTYFNLAGHDHGTIRDHIVYIDSDVLTEVDSELIPTGNYWPVAQTPLDLRDGLLLGEGLDAMNDCQTMIDAGGYDHNFVLRKGAAMGLAACVHHEETGRTMEVITDQPGVQLYTACTTSYTGAKDGATYGHFCGLCLETQHYPDSPNQPHFPSTVLRPGEKYDTTTIYAFRID